MIKYGTKVISSAQEFDMFLHHSGWPESVIVDYDDFWILFNLLPPAFRYFNVRNNATLPEFNWRPWTVISCNEFPKDRPKVLDLTAQASLELDHGRDDVEVNSPGS